ncbi:copper chaperone PCu(A)C [Marinihelvus fidelis]|uniref:Copper chaperone PCu(A)C n=1 Tax=Marinihelvus fidelis TaxID=2613842 RepID=A0A5N0TD12_9GAMM|nr:copper chaperone PCu(A)C [Marinihelvus fidelis]KAA9131947.1 copper chaperone PCu(A)C [Marinihelvus fidelis]
MTRLRLLACLLAGLAGTAQAEITATEAWARATPPGARNGAAYLYINNSGESDRLESVSGKVSERIEIHAHIHADGMMKMERQDGVDVANGTTTFEPGGLHLMLLGLDAPLVAGESFQLVLHFAQAGDRTITVEIRDARQ